MFNISEPIFSRESFAEMFVFAVTVNPNESGIIFKFGICETIAAMLPPPLLPPLPEDEEDADGEGLEESEDSSSSGINGNQTLPPV